VEVAIRLQAIAWTFWLLVRLQLPAKKDSNHREAKRIVRTIGHVLDNLNVEAETEIDRALIHPNKTEDLKITLHISTPHPIGHNFLVREIGEVRPTHSEISLQEEVEVQEAEEEVSLQEEIEVPEVEEVSPQEVSHQEIEEVPVDEVEAIFQIVMAVFFILQ